MSIYLPKALVQILQFNNFPGFQLNSTEVAMVKYYTVFPLVFSKLFPGFPNFFQVFKSKHFWVYFSFKLISIKETVLNSTKTFKRCCKVTLNVFFNEKLCG